MPGRVDAIVVGSGPNGLTGAIALARAGLRVRVIEAAPTPGGGARTVGATLPGFWHDHCSAVHPMAAASPYLRRLPLEAHGLRWIEPPVAAAHPLDDRPAALLCRDPRATAETLGPDRHYADWIGPLVEAWPHLMRAGMGPPALPRAGHWALGMFGGRALLPVPTLAEVAFGGVEARALLAGLAAHSVLPLERPPAAAIGLMLQLAAHAVGWPFPEGGAGALTSALVRLLQAHGGELVLGHKITRISEVDDQLERDGVALFDLGPRAVADICGARLPPAFHRAAARFRYGPGAFKIDYALDGPLPWTDPRVAEAGTVHLGGTLEEICAAERAPWEGRLAERPYVLLAQQSHFDPSRAPAGQHTGWAYCHVPPGFTGDATAAIEAQIERFAPGFRDRVLARHITRPADFEAANPNLVGGDVNGGAPILTQLLTRPVASLWPWRTADPRIFLCSASTPPGGGVHGMGGYNAAFCALNGRIEPLA
jgi:phytoene dehydrogenase-like protein